MKKLFSICFALLGLTLAVSCNGDKPGPEEPPVNDGLVIEASPRYILADGAQTTNFTVKNNGVDVTAKTKIVNFISGGSKTLASPSFKTSEVGTHVFYAIYDGASSARINVVGATTIPQMAADVMPSKYDFKKRVLIHQSTGAWCGNCPYVIKAIHEFAAAPKATDAIFVAAHNGNDPFVTAKSNELNSEYNITAYPTITVELSKEANRKMSSEATAVKLRSQVDDVLKTAAVSGIAVSTKVVGGKICVNAEVKVGTAGALKIGALLIENDLFAEQNNTTSITGEYLNYHDYVVRNGAPAGALYEALGGLDKVSASSKYQYYCEFDVKGSKIADLTKTSVVLFVYNADKGVCDNVVAVGLDVQLPYEYL